MSRPIELPEAPDEWCRLIELTLALLGPRAISQYPEGWALYCDLYESRANAWKEMWNMEISEVKS